jgi:hypothetical protein
MAKTDPTDPGNPASRWSFKEWMSGVQNFFGGGSRVVVIPTGGSGMTAGGAPPPEALLARQRMSDRAKGFNVMSRMEEAKQKNQVWDNELYPLINGRLQRMFHPENYARMRLTPSIWNNAMRRIVEDISILYEMPPRRYLKKDKKTEQTSGSAGESMVEDGGVEETETKPPVEEDNTETKDEAPAKGKAPVKGKVH